MCLRWVRLHYVCILSDTNEGNKLNAEVQSFWLNYINLLDLIKYTRSALLN